ncbi:MAG: ShlB/FhaC/HecB family hemolysin secretion/activation protein [Burkholderiales bacterium]|uniref:ShlB/FhaC/HecB family hemolysin secretion/activation protein n=1 Tax=Roseateles sp. TaxID=1971397 RepID=UPI000FBCEEF2|nr:MAG: ShlB/FhaC/HecB family hemolysin secretion/activation protein [Burkholderiales bacterium]
MKPLAHTRTAGPHRRLLAASLAGLALACAGAAFAQQPPVSAPRFDILEYEVEGNTVLGAAAIERAVMPFLGPQRSLDDAEAARAALEKAYQNAGYLTVFVDLPEQLVDGGVVRLKVLEGRVDRLAVTGARYYDQGRIRERVTELAEGQVPNFNEVQKQLAQVNNSETRQVQPVLRPGLLPGTVEAELQVKDKLPLSGFVEVSNAATANTTAERATANLRYDNLWQLGHSIGLTVTTAPTAPKQTTVTVLNYGIPLAQGDNLSLYATHSSSNTNSLGGTQVLGKGNTLGLRYGINLGISEQWAQNLSLGFDYRNVQQQVRFGSASITKPLRYMPLQAGYTANWFGPSRQGQLALTMSFGLSPLLARRIDGCELEDGSIGVDDQFRCSRKGADGGFSTLRMDLRHTENFANFSIAGRVAGQLATQQLTSAEQFTLGGADTVRGYYESAAVGDLGLMASLELRSANLATWLQRRHPGEALADLGELSLLAFVDAGRVQTINPDPGQALRQPLLGTGVGVRFASRSGVNLDLTIAEAHRAIAGAPKPGTRAHARMFVKF